VNRRLLLTASTAASLSGLYVLYALLVTPLFTPQITIASPGISTNTRLPGGRYQTANEREAARYLADQPWTANAKYQVRTEEAYFYAEEWEQIPDSKKVRFRPMALLWRSKGEPADAEPIAIMAESALVEFATKFDMKTNPSPGRIIGGALEGVVRIRGPKGLSITGRNFNFSEDALRVWSDNPIAFRYGPNRGQGHGMELDLIPETGLPGQDKPAISGVRTARLLRDVVMELESEPKGNGRPAEHVTITCAGNFDFGVETHVASFHKDVRVAHPTGNRQFDRLNSDILTLVFEPESTPDAAVPAAGEPVEQGAFSKSIDPELGFRRLRAEGAPAILTSDRGDLRTTMTELTYDAQSKVLAMRSAQQVRLTQKNNEIVCPEITADHDDDGEIVRAVCRGAGKLTRFDLEQPLQGGRRPIAFTAEWSKQLQKFPDAESKLDLIELEGNAQVHQTGQLAMRAGIIRLWIEPDGKDPETPRVSKSSRADFSDTRARPKRMLALDQVTFGSPQITGDTERLEVWFEPGALPAAPPVAPADAVQRVAPAPPAANIRIVPAGQFSVPSIPTAQAGNRGTVVQSGSASNSAARPDGAPPAAGSRTPSRKGGLNKAATDRPVHISARLIRVRALVEGERTDVAEVITEGQVVVSQQHDDASLPLKITGETLHLWNHSEFHQVVDVHGKPAQIRDRGMELEGKTIHFDRGENLVRVDGKGLLRLPVKNSLDGKPLPQAKALDIWWNEQMHFDGATARFFVGVRAALDQDELRCEEMIVTLSRRISFADGPDDSEDIEVRNVVCRDGVELKSHEYEGNRMTGVRKATGFEFSLNQKTGAITAAGPGMLEFLRRGSAKRAGLEPASGVKANRPLQTDPVNWEYTRVDFAGKMEGNSIDRTSTFRDRVRILYGPVDRVTDKIDEDDLPKDGGWLRCDLLSLQQHPETPTKKAYFEILGSGNAELEGRTFHALGDNISYDESKGLYIISANGRRNATIWREAVIGATRQMAVGRRFRFIPAFNELHVDEASNFQGSP
jgi:hypothetical protein